MTRMKIRPEYAGDNYSSDVAFHAVRCDSSHGWDLDIPGKGLALHFQEFELHEVVSHRGEYDETHWGERDPDAWDRLSYEMAAEFGDTQRHLLHTGTE